MKFDILDHIPFGEENAISMEELSIRTGKDKRVVRKEIYNARTHGMIICSSCSDGRRSGYFQPNTVGEVQRYVAMQHSRIRSATKAVQSAIDFLGNEGAVK